ncbi:MAG: GNAT family N-acetyltransferase [Lachnospiraceae bacterium]|nr:GNAT family N-acetyltransferase [Lachnospiraceae bacterium]
MNDNIQIRKMTCEDYDDVNDLWHSIKGFVLRSIDDSREGVERFIRRNPDTCVVAEESGRIVGSILCGHDGRKGCMYHVCVSPDHRRRGIGKSMVSFALEKLKEEKINDVSIIAFSKNDVGNLFWNKLGWEMQDNINSYEIRINKENIRTENKE